VKPPFTYLGGKTAIAGKIAALLPQHEHYVETHAGSPAAARLRDVSLECSDALEMVARYGRGERTLLYVDPPYLESVRAKCSGGRSRGPYYVHETRTDAEHGELLDALLGCKSAVVLSGYPSQLYDTALAGWHRREIPTQTGNGGEDRDRTEVIWSNRPFPDGTLF